MARAWYLVWWQHNEVHQPLSPNAQRQMTLPSNEKAGRVTRGRLSPGTGNGIGPCRVCVCVCENNTSSRFSSSSFGGKLPQPFRMFACACTHELCSARNLRMEICSLGCLVKLIHLSVQKKLLLMFITISCIGLDATLVNILLFIIVFQSTLLLWLWACTTHTTGSMRYNTFYSTAWPVLVSVVASVRCVYPRVPVQTFVLLENNIPEQLSVSHFTNQHVHCVFAVTCKLLMCSWRFSLRREKSILHHWTSLGDCFSKNLL